MDPNRPPSILLQAIYIAPLVILAGLVARGCGWLPAP